MPVHEFGTFASIRTYTIGDPFKSLRSGMLRAEALKVYREEFAALTSASPATSVHVVERGVAPADHARELDQRVRVRMAHDPRTSYREATYAELALDPWLKQKLVD